MKKILGTLLVIMSLAACKEKETTGKFTVNGELKNAPNQKIYLEQLFFSQKDPEVLDTGEIKNGKFTVTATGNEEGLYRLRFEKQEVGFIFINDKPSIDFKADVNDVSLQGPDFNSPANHSFKSFLTGIDNRQKTLNALSAQIDSLKAHKSSDSVVTAQVLLLNNDAADFQKFIIKSIDTISDPVVTMFALGYTRGIDPALLKGSITGLTKRFPTHRGIAGIVSEYNALMAKKDAPQQTSGKGIGNDAPEITMADTSGKPFSLSSLKGKYVLVDFWASWCGPCRGENPNVVANYNKYKNKNFTVLGVSLDDDKAAWINAIQKDKLTWQHVSDLKKWGSAAVGLYGFDGIPYNVLVDPQGKIIAAELRGEALGQKLAEVLK